MPIETDTEAINVEGILANFFLGKFEMEDSKSDSDSSGRRRKKHKKHKSKKSKSKKRSRSRSPERKSKDSLYTGNYSSSEEKDILRLQRLKKLDFKDNKSTFVDISNISEASNSHTVVLNADTNSRKESDIPYGPSLETHLSGGSDVPKENVTRSSESEFTSNKSGKDSSTIEENKNKTNILPLEKIKHDKDESTFGTACEVNKMTAQDEIKDSNGKKDLKSKKVTESLPADEVKYPKEEKPSEKQNSSSQSKHKSHKRKKRSYTKSRSRSVSNSRSKRKSRSRSVSNSRSKRKSRSRSRSRDNKKSYKDRSARRSSRRSLSRHRSRSSSYNRNRSRSHYKRYRSRTPVRDKGRYTSHDDRKYSSSSRRRRSSSSEYDYRSRKSKRRSRSSSVDRERSSPKSHKIDQEKIRQIAQKNVLNMIEKGTLPEGLSLENFKKEQLVSLKAGGKSVQELTDFCAKLSKKENDPHQEEGDTTGNDNSATEEGFIHHPFKIKETSAIKLNIKNAVQIPIKTHAEKVAETARLSSQFPVSSGNQHRQKELEWVPVEPKVKEEKVPKEIKALVPLSQSSTTTESPQSIGEEDKQTAATDSLSSENPTATSIPVPKDLPVPALLPPPLPPTLPSLPPPPPPPPPPNNLLSFSTPTDSVCIPVCTPNNFAMQQTFSYPVATMESSYYFPQPETSYFMQPQQTVFPVSTATSFKSKKSFDVATIVNQRFQAITKLISHPNDLEALQNKKEAENSMQDWVQSHQVPGQFTGHPLAKPLSVEEMSGPKHWIYRAKKNLRIFFTSFAFLHSKCTPVASPQFVQENR